MANSGSLDGACRAAVKNAAQQVLHTVHWRWQADPVMVEGRDEKRVHELANQLAGKLKQALAAGL